MSTTLAAARFSAEVLAAYKRWAPLYPAVAHNPLMRAEQRAMLECWPDIAGRRALDLACGTGRYANLLADSLAEDVVAVDFCAPMLARVMATHRVRASMLNLPFLNGAFDVVICGLAVGHTTDLRAWMAEVGRVLKPDGVLLYSDFHPAAARAGLPRSFKDEHNRTTTVPHHAHGLNCQRQAAAAANLTVEAMRTVRVGFELTERFAQSDEFYGRWHGLPLVLVVRARK